MGTKRTDHSNNKDAIILLTEKQETFAQGLFTRMSKSNAYKAAYKTENMKPNVIAQEAYLLSLDPAVAARVKQLRDDVAIANHMDLDYFLGRLNHVIDKAEVGMDFGLVRQALMDQAKLLGLGADKLQIELSNKFSDKSSFVDHYANLLVMNDSEQTQEGS